ncbi:MAG: T9SS type B sorting domain-containing protein [Bacteroidota bacterium]
MFRSLLWCCCLLSALLGAQDFAPVTVVCTEGPYVLRSPLTDANPRTYRWERSFDGGTSWAATGTDAPELPINNPVPGIRYRLLYGTNTACLEDPTCRQITSATELFVQIPTFNQGLTRCAGDTVFVGAQALTTAGNHRTVLRTTGGCDSIVNTFLQLRDRYAELYFLDRCVGEEVNGIPITRDTTIVQSFVAATGCDSTVTYEVNVALDANAGLTISGPDVTCPGEAPPTLSGPGGYASYRWSTGARGQSINPAASGTYELTVTDVTGCARELRHELLIAELALGEIMTTAPACPDGDDGGLVIQTNGGEDLLYSIDGGETFRMSPEFAGLAAGDYPLVVENAVGCRVGMTTTVPSAPALQLASDFAGEQTIERGDSLALRITANFPVAEWRWSPARWMHQADSATTLLFPAVDVNFRVEAAAAGGCAVSDTFSIIVRDSRRYFAPTAFSPNGDDRNDVWRIFPGPRATAVSDLQIADRWGGIRYVQAGDFPPEEVGWDGTENGTPLPPGNYLYSAAIRFADGSTLPVQGQFTLLR